MTSRILEQLVQVQARCPEFRFGQLIATIAALGEDETGNSLWDIDDADFAAALARFAGDLARRAPIATESNITPDRPAMPFPPRAMEVSPPRGA